MSSCKNCGVDTPLTYCSSVCGGRFRQQARRRHVQVYKQLKGCTDCGYNAHWAALDFDHVRGEKLFTVAQQIGKVGTDKLWAEIAKCEVVCANCHRIRTQERL